MLDRTETRALVPYCEPATDVALVEGVCDHCAAVIVGTATYCSYDCQIKALEAAQNKRIAELEAKVEERISAGVEKALQERRRQENLEDYEREREEWERQVAYQRDHVAAEQEQARRRRLTEEHQRLLLQIMERQRTQGVPHCVPGRASLLGLGDHAYLGLQANPYLSYMNLANQQNALIAHQNLMGGLMGPAEPPSGVAISQLQAAESPPAEESWVTRALRRAGDFVDDVALAAKTLP